jgi:superfamily I DNA/RNA helicase
MTLRLPRPDLSPAQLAAVEAPGGVFVDAGAGSGKTTVLVERYVRSVTERNHLPAQVLAVTFTTRAAGEMRERIRGRLRFEGRDDLIPLVESGWIGTIHATCRRILAEFSEQAGLASGLRVADQVETVLLRDAAFERALASMLHELGDPGLQLVALYGRDRLREIAGELLNGARTRGRPVVAPSGASTIHELEAAIAELVPAAIVVSAAGTDSDQAVKRRQAALDLLDLLERNPEPIELADLKLYTLGDAAYKALIAEVELQARDVLVGEFQAPLQVLLDGYSAAYAAAKTEVGAVDNDDLQLRVRQLLETHADVRATLQERFREVMVDEFQDTDSLQNAIIRLVRAPGTPLLAVGDEQQAIYGFRGAEVEVFRGERETAVADQTIEVVSLHENRRSTPPVIAAINAIFSREDRFTHRPLTPFRSYESAGQGLPVELLIGVGDDLDSGREVEATLVARRLRDLVDRGVCQEADIAVVFRAGTRAAIYESALRAEGLSTVSSTGRGFLQRQPVGDVLALLRVLWNRYDDLALLACLASPFAGVSNDGLALMREAVEWEFADALDNLGSIGLKDDDLARAVTLRDAIARLRSEVGRLGLGDLVAAIIAETRYDLAMLAMEDGAERMANLEKLRRVAHAFDDAQGSDIPGFVRAIESGRLDGELKTEGVIASEGAAAIRLLSVHQAKGLEFPVVVFADTASKTPAQKRLAIVPSEGVPAAKVPASTNEMCSTRALSTAFVAVADAGERESHRIAYVACTRARDHLIISGARGPKLSIGTTLEWLLGLIDDDAALGERVLELDAAQVGILVSDVSVAPALPPAIRDDTVEYVLDDGGPQLAFDVDAVGTMNGETGSELPPLRPLGQADEWVVPSLSYSSLDLFERCGYRFHTQRMLGLPSAQAGGAAPVGKAVHEAIELGANSDAGALLLEIEPAATAAEQTEARAALERWNTSPLQARFAALADVRHEQPFLLLLGGATVTGAFDLSARDGDCLVIGDIKVGGLKGQTPDERRDHGYTIQEELYALAGLEAGHASVEVAYQWIGDDLAASQLATRVFEASQREQLRAGLEARVQAALTGPWRPTPSKLMCESCPALGLLCAGTDLPSAHG